MRQKKTLPFSVFIFFLIMMILSWFYTKDLEAKWLNVPPAPSLERSAIFALGDSQMAYRFYTIMLQNLGNVGGEVQALKNYNYNQLKDWFFLLDQLDSQSDAVPLLAAYYFGAVNDPDKLKRVIDYLVIVGSRPEGEKWRWLGHAVFIARHVIKDNELALDLAYKLAANKSPDLADWAKQMPAFILQEEGDTKEAFDIMMSILISNVDTLHPAEINFMTDYICNTILINAPTIEKPEFCD
ncbi:MAG: hypothetical protein AAF549_07875 [Pseudomonadota bacterium]